jgi:hypothetical protein
LIGSFMFADLIIQRSQTAAAPSPIDISLSVFPPIIYDTGGPEWPSILTLGVEITYRTGQII